MPGTPARDRAEGRIEGARDLGGLFVEAVHAMRLPIVLTDPGLPGDPIVFANQAFLDLSGYAMEELLGQQPHFMNGPDTDPEDAARFREILAEDRDGVVETIQYAKDGRRFVASVLLSGFKDDGGKTINHFLSWTDVTRRVDAEEDAANLRTTHAALWESEERLRTFGDASQDVLWMREADTLQWTYLNPGFEIVYGISREKALEGDNYRSWLDMVVPEDCPDAEAHIAKVRAGENAVLECRIRRPDGEIRWLRNTDFPIRNAAGNVGLLGGIGHDITRLKLAETALRDSEERLRLIVGNAEDYAIFTIDRDGKCTDWREGAEAVFGFSRDEMMGQSGDILFTPEDREKGQPEKERAVAAAEGKAPDVRWHMRKDGSRVFIDGVSTALRNAEGELIGFLKIGQDVTERHGWEGRQKLLLQELQHRVRNILGMIRSIVRQSNDEYDDIDEYSAHLSGRLDALARTQVLLTRAEGAKVDLEGLVRDELAAQIVDYDRYEIEGPPVALSPKAAEVLGLALHELGTNSIKYGALAEARGRIDIRWSVAPIGEDSWLQLVWQEYCALKTTEPIRRGFGTELIERRVPYELGGEATLDLTSHGVRAEIAFPLVDGTSVLETGPERRVGP